MPAAFHLDPDAFVDTSAHGLLRTLSAVVVVLCCWALECLEGFC